MAMHLLPEKSNKVYWGEVIPQRIFRTEKSGPFISFHLSLISRLQQHSGNRLHNTEFKACEYVIMLLRLSILSYFSRIVFYYGPLVRYVKLQFAHAPGMPGTFSPPPRVSHPDMHHGTCVTHIPWCMPGSLTSGFLWSRWQGKCSRHSRRMRNPQFYVSGNRLIVTDII